MKKLMIAAAIVCAAAFAQAASCTWGTPMTAFAGQSDTDENTYTVTWAIIEGASADAFSDVKFENGVLTGATAFDEGSSMVALGDGQMGDITGATAGKYYALVINYGDDVNMWGISDAWLAETDPSDASGNTLFDFTFMNGEAFESPAMVATETVPEPTTGLLMLLGMGALALRRRRA